MRFQKSALALATALTIAAAGAPAALADPPHRRGFQDTAKVVKVTPLTRTVRVSEPRRECWEEPVTRYRERRVVTTSDSYTPAILGGILGGVAGNQFGSGTGKDVMTIAGTVLGASIGRDHNNRPRYAAEPYRTYEERCRVVDDYYEEDRVDGYRVTYRYKGRHYTTTMDHHPGDRIPVGVSVYPLED